MKKISHLIIKRLHTVRSSGQSCRGITRMGGVEWFARTSQSLPVSFPFLLMA